MSRQNALAGPEGPATAARSAVGLVPRPRPAVPAINDLRQRRSSDPGAGAGDRLRTEHVDRHSEPASTQQAGHDLDDLDDEYLEYLELPAQTDPDQLGAGTHDDREATTGSQGNHERDGVRGRVEAAGRRRLPAAPRRHPALLLAALVAGAVIAGATSGVVGPASSSATSAQDYGLGAEEIGFAGGVDVAGARGEISQAEAQARLAEIAASRAARQPSFVLPTQGRMSTCFCTRWGAMHWGIDLAAPLGTPIFAAADGVVLRAGPASGYGNAIYIQDADGNVEIYGHMRYLFVRAGDVVSAGDPIAKVGSEGQSTGPHLHFEIHEGGMAGRPTDPQRWLADRGIIVG